MPTIRMLREARGWSQVALAGRIGVAPSTVYNWERGKYAPRAEQWKALAEVFGLRMDEIDVNPPRRDTEGTIDA